MADRIKLRRGPKNKMDLNVYELGYVTDSTEKRLYFNDGSMVPIPNEKDITDIRAELTETTNVSEQNKKDVLELKENVAGIIKTGVAKLVQYSYDIELSETTKSVNIPYKKYSSVTDTLKVYVNGLAIQNDQYTITDPVENEDIITNGYITLKVERPAGTIVRIEVWKNVPSGEEGEVNGNVIAQNSLPLDRIIGIGDITSKINTIANNGFNDISKPIKDLTDMNSFTTAGIYGGIIQLSNSILNLPLYSSNVVNQRVKIEVTCDESTKVIISQKMTYQDGVFKNRVFLRTRVSPTQWNNWVELINSSRVINNFTTTEDGFVADAKALKTLYDLATRLVPASIVATLNDIDYYDYTIPSGTLTNSPQIWAVVGDKAGSTYVVYTKKLSDTVIRIGLNAPFKGNIRFNVLYKIQ